eukprot:m.73496 g.73496  ORF g.73496 m.73496 type:complete len:314 (-) comp12422_c1_seq1:962-1903(-)
MAQQVLRQQKVQPPQQGLPPWSDAQRDRIQQLLQQPLGPEYIADRPGPGGAKVLYLEGFRTIHLANETFGHDGWTSEIKDSTLDFIERNQQGLYHVGCSAIVRVTLRGGSFHEDVGYGTGQAKDRAKAMERAKKSSITDATKRALKMFGNALGLCLHDKEYLKVIKRAQKKEKITYELDNMKRHSMSNIHNVNKPAPPNITPSSKPPISAVKEPVTPNKRNFVPHGNNIQDSNKRRRMSPPGSNHRPQHNNPISLQHISRNEHTLHTPNQRILPTEAPKSSTEEDDEDDPIDEEALLSMLAVCEESESCLDGV